MTRVFTRSSAPYEREIDLILSFANRHRLKWRVDTDGTKIISGKSGQIYEYDNYMLGLVVMPDPPRKRYWGCARIGLLEAGMTLLQDGDGEGATTFDPNDPIQAKLAIRIAGIKRKRQMSPAQREQRIAFLRSAQERHIGPQEARERHGQGKNQGARNPGQQIDAKPRSAVPSECGGLGL